MLDLEFMKNRIKEINKKALYEFDEKKLKKLIDEKIMWERIYDCFLKNNNKKVIT